jgi:hypothetical protein
MKNTIIMLACIATFIITWMTISTIGYLITDGVAFKGVATNGGVIMIMLVFGWIPSFAVGMDLVEKNY